MQPSLDNLQLSIKDWQFWFATIASQNKLARPLQRWDSQGIVLRKDKILIGPYTEFKEAIGGFILINAKDYDEAIEIAKNCPIIKFGGNVEIRIAISLD